MQTRQTSKTGVTAGKQHSVGGGAVGSCASLDMQTQIQTPAVIIPDLGTQEQMVPESPADWIQQMQECERLGWRGGDEFYDGLHDNFCFVCGSTMELFACQTCESCYHAECMTPSLDPGDVPKFWFCPHCVDQELHIPSSPSGLRYVQPNSSNTPAYPSPDSGVLSPEKRSGVSDHTTSSNPVVLNVETEIPQRQSVTQNNFSAPFNKTSDSGHATKPGTKSRSRPIESSKFGDAPGGKPGRSSRISSPPRKKSKYSAFSVEVDKALAVLYAELETAAQFGKAEGHLESKVLDLEQKLKLQDGQLLLSNRELDFARNHLTKEQAISGLLKKENVDLKNEVSKLQDQLQHKNDALRDWRTKLRTMVGSDLE